MKYIKLFEYFNNTKTFVGFHCSDKDYKIYNGSIDSAYFDRYEEILKNLNNKEASDYLDRIKINGIDHDTEISNDIYNYFNKIRLRCIFVCEDTPLKRYGNICYKVYFKNMDNVIQLDDNYHAIDDHYSYIYLYYDGNEPILTKL